MQHAYDDLVLCAGAHLVHKAGKRRIARVGKISEHLAFWDELIKAGVGKQHHAALLPCVAADAGRFSSRSDLDGRYAPCLGELIPIALTVRSRAGKARYAEKVDRAYLSVLLAAVILCFNIPRGNDRGYLHSPAASARGYLLIEIFSYVICDAAHGEEIVDAAVKGHFEALFHTLAKAEVGILVAVGQPLEAHLLVHEARYKPRFVRKRSTAVQESVPRADVEIGFPVTGDKHRHRHDIMFVRI